MADYKLIVVSDDARGKLRGYSMEFNKWREVKLVLDEIRGEGDYDVEDSYFFGGVEVTDEDGDEYYDFPPDFATEGYCGLVDAETRHFFERFYGITDPDLEEEEG